MIWYIILTFVLEFVYSILVVEASGWGYYYVTVNISVALLEDIHALILTVVNKWRISGHYINTGLYYVHYVYWYCLY